MVLGGDLTGKMIVPIVEHSDHIFTANWPNERTVKPEELEEFEKEIRNHGFYAYRTTTEEADRLVSDRAKMDELFKTLIAQTLSNWCDLAETHLKGQNKKCFMQLGNDDMLGLDSILDGRENIVSTEGKVVRIDGEHEMISTGYANITPWSCPRDIPETTLSEKIEGMAKQVANMNNCIFNFHCPPYDSGLDEAPELDEELKMKASGSGVSTKPVGSVAVRSAIEKYQPLLALVGHVHEGKGQARIGRTLCINPGSEYTEGILRGVVIDLDEKGIKSYTPTSG
jgi:Icc-related predicted phosphoesterase